MSEPVEDDEARVRPRQIDGDPVAVRCANRRGLFEQRRRLLDAWKLFDAFQQLFFKTVCAARAQLQARRADHRMDDFACGARDALAGDRARKHERDGDRDTHTREQLLGGVDTQPSAVEVDEHRGRHQRTRLYAHILWRLRRRQLPRWRQGLRRQVRALLSARVAEPAVAQLKAAVGEHRGLDVVGYEEHAGVAFVSD